MKGRVVWYWLAVVGALWSSVFTAWTAYPPSIGSVLAILGSGWACGALLASRSLMLADKKKITKMVDLPIPPENVRIEYPGGRTVPLQCRYEGVVDGVHVWTAIVPSGVEMDLGMDIHFSMLPPKTRVEVEIQGERHS